MIKVLLLMQHAESVYWFRIELIQKLIDEGFAVHIAVPEYETIIERLPKDVMYHEVNFNRRGVNPIEDVFLYFRYKKLIKESMPGAILSFAIKPNIYGSLAARKFKVPIINNITGLGTALQNNKGFLYTIVKVLYKFALRDSFKVFFQNNEGLLKFHELKIIKLEQAMLIPGSGVNTDRFRPREQCYTPENGYRLLMVARVMKEKGIQEFIDVATLLKKEYPNLEFQIAGMIEEQCFYNPIMNLQNQGVLTYLGEVTDIRDIMQKADCIILPTYHEGLSNVLLEGSAMEKPIIGTNISGCKEIIEDEITGFLCEPRSAESLEIAVRKFLNLSTENRIIMGKKGREKIIKEFDRNIVVGEYVQAIKDLLLKKK